MGDGGVTEAKTAQRERVRKVMSFMVAVLRWFGVVFEIVEWECVGRSVVLEIVEWECVVDG
jgi:hypothetical protein